MCAAIVTQLVTQPSLWLQLWPAHECPGLGGVWWSLSGWVAESDLDRGEVDGPLEDVLAPVGARSDRAEGLELVEGAFGGVALLVGRGVELRWSPADAAYTGSRK